MDGKKAYSTFNGVMLGFLILIALSLAAVLLFTKSSVFSKIDEHGCNNSGGYTFSYAKAKCIKIYEEAVQLNKTGSNNPNDLKAFIVFYILTTFFVSISKRTLLNNPLTLERDI